MGRAAAWRLAGGVRPVAIATGLMLALALGGAPALALAPPTPWNGVNPFHCTVQDAGQGTTVPDPRADPYCVHFDKTNQNVTQLGLVTFLTEEPARSAAAVPKCFYYQEDHWRGSVIQSDQQTVVYEFYGHYFFNKATGDGGVWVTHFALAGQTFDPRSLPGFPPQYDQDFGPGTGGFISHNDVPTDPNCVAQASQSPGAIYTKRAPHCLGAHGAVTGRHVGPVWLGEGETRVRARLGQPESAKGGLVRYCLSSGGALIVGGGRGQAAAGSPSARTVIVLTTGSAFRVSGRRGRTITVGASLSQLRSAFREASRTFRVRRESVFAITPAQPRNRAAGVIIAGVARGHVKYLGVYDPRAVRTHRALAAYLRQAM